MPLAACDDDDDDDANAAAPVAVADVKSSQHRLFFRLVSTALYT